MPGATVARWDRHQILQHLVLVVCFTTLVVTGTPLRVPQASLSRAVMRVLGGADQAALLHRAAAVGLILLGVYHGLYLFWRWRRYGRVSAMWPRVRDFRDLLQVLRYFFGLSPDKARFDRDNYAEKFEYWALVWGSAVMILTGLILWFPTVATRVLPAVVLELAKVIHGYEAVLAALAILIWHFYHVHLNPAAFPMSKTWLTGRISRKEMEEEHPLELERLARKAPAEPEPAEETPTPT